MANKESHPIQGIMQDAMVKIKDIIDVNTVVGKPITCLDGTMIIPITKVSVGFVAGGGEYSQNIPPKNAEKEYPFAGGSGAGFSVQPVGFLVGKEGSLKLLTVENGSSFEEIMKIVKNITEKITK